MPPKGKKRTPKTAESRERKDDQPSKKLKLIPSDIGEDVLKLNLENDILDETWRLKLTIEFEKSYYKSLIASLQRDYSRGETIFPSKEKIFNAFSLTPFDKVKVVILGQDPYHDDGQAHGLSFSVCDGVKFPPSLKNIFKELESDIKGFKTPKSGSLEKWAKEGVLLLNATLTVMAHKPNSHSKYGWQTFTDNVIKLLSSEKEGLVFLLWGGFAHKKQALIDSAKHQVLLTAHPSPLSFNKFKNCKCFSKVNNALESFGKSPIDWTL